MLVVNTKEIFLQNLHQNRVHFPAERNPFVFDHQHGCRDVTCKQAIAVSATLFVPWSGPDCFLDIAENQKMNRVQHISQFKYRSTAEIALQHTGTAD